VARLNFKTELIIQIQQDIQCSKEKIDTLKHFTGVFQTRLEPDHEVQH
jgi:hypothetical protein